MKTVPLAEAKAKLSGLIDEVARRDERVTITKRGRPTAVLMSHDELMSLDATLEIMSDPEFYADILRNRRALERGQGVAYDPNDLFGEEVPAVNAKSTRTRSARNGRNRPTAAARDQTKGARGAGRTRTRPSSR